MSCDRDAARVRCRSCAGLIAARREMREATREQTSVVTSNDRFNEILCRSAADLAMLMTDTPQGRYPYAGIPWYLDDVRPRRPHHRAADAVVDRPTWRAACCAGLPLYQAKTTDPLADAAAGKNPA